MKNKVIIMYTTSPEDNGILVDGTQEQDENKIIDNLCRITGMPRIRVTRILNICKKSIATNNYSVSDLESETLAAIERIRRLEIHETV